MHIHEIINVKIKKKQIYVMKITYKMHHSINILSANMNNKN